MGKDAILITGHTGFIGRAIVDALKQHPLTLAGRRQLHHQPGQFFHKELTAEQDFSDCLAGVDVVIHAAAQVHSMQAPTDNTVAFYRAINVDATINIAKQAAAAGVKRFIFISSIKVNGEETHDGQRFTPNDASISCDAYGQSKAEAEAALRQLATETGLEVVIIRPPLVYGPGVKANFAAMLRLAKWNLPLPFGAIHNKRSMVALANLVDLVKICVSHPNAANQTFLVSDDHDVSTTEMLQLMIRAYGKRPRLIPIPASWLWFVGKLTGKQAIVSRLCGSLQLDISFTKAQLNWTPPITVAQGIQSCIDSKDPN